MLSPLSYIYLYPRVSASPPTSSLYIRSSGLHSFFPLSFFLATFGHPSLYLSLSRARELVPLSVVQARRERERERPERVGEISRACLRERKRPRLKIGILIRGPSADDLSLEILAASSSLCFAAAGIVISSEEFEFWRDARCAGVYDRDGVLCWDLLSVWSNICMRLIVRGL